MRLSENALKKLIKGTFLATLLLAAQEGGQPLHEAAWILVGATLTTVVDAYATHLSNRSYGNMRAYVGSLWVGIVEDSPRTFASFPTVLLLFCAWMFHWGQRSPESRWQCGRRLRNPRVEHQRRAALYLRGSCSAP